MPRVLLVRKLGIVVQVAHYRYPVSHTLGSPDGHRGGISPVILVITTLSRDLVRRRVHHLIREEQERHAHDEEDQRQGLVLNAEGAARDTVDVRCAQRLSPIA